MTRARDLADFNLDGKAVTINESSADLDFRVEGNGNANLLFVDAGNDRIGIGVSTPAAVVDIKSSGATSTALRVLKSSAAQNLYAMTEISGHGRVSIYDGSENEDIRLDTNGVSYFNGGNVGIGETTPVTPLTIATTNKLGSTFTGTTNGEGLTVTQTNFTSGNYISLVEAAYDDSGDGSPNVRIGAMFDGGGSNLAFGTSNSYGSGITNTAMFIDSSGNVGISTTAPVANLEIEDGGTSNSIITKITADDQNPYALMIGNDTYSATDSNAFGFVQRNDGAAYIYNGGALRAAFHSVSSGVLSLEGGVVLGAGAANSTTANTLKDYEEGTFTPVAEGESSAGSGSYSYQVGSYVKVGSLVLFQANIQFTSHSGSGTFRLSGLPFTAKNTTNLFAVASAYLNGLPVASNHRAMPFVRPNTTYVNINQENGSGGASSVSIDAAAQVLITGSYRTDD